MCNDDGAIILKLIKSLLDGATINGSGDAYGGEEAEILSTEETSSGRSTTDACLAPIMPEIEYDLERHVKKYGPTTEDTVLCMHAFPAASPSQSGSMTSQSNRISKS